MKVVILAGGLGTRLPEYTYSIPKPMVEINNKPIIHHIMNHYAKYNFKIFTLRLAIRAMLLRNILIKKLRLEYKFNRYW